MITENTIDQNTETGVEISASTFSGEISRNTIAGIFQGFSEAEASRLFAVDTQGNRTISPPSADPGESGVLLIGTAADDDVQIANNAISNFKSYGVIVLSDGFELSPGVFAKSFFRGSIVNNNFEQTVSGVGLFDFLDSFDVLLSGGNVLDNTFRENFVGVDVKFMDNTAHFTGNIERNRFVDTQALSIGIVAQNFTGNISDNTVTSTGNLAATAVGGISIFFESDPETAIFLGNISGNQVSGIAGDAISISTPFNTAFVGNIENNVVTDNEGSGLFLTSNSFTGSFSGNRAERNGLGTNGGVGLSLFTQTISGSVTSNLANDNNGTGIQIVAQRVTGQIAKNTANANSSHGIRLDTAQFNGRILGNLANDNNGAGIEIFAPHSTGQIENNTANANASHGIRLDTAQFNGRIFGNSTNDNGASGVATFLVSNPDPFTPSSLTGTFSGNQANRNGSHGFEFRERTAIDSLLSLNMTGNTASENSQFGLLIGDGRPDFEGTSETDINQFTGSLIDNEFLANGQEGLFFRIRSNFEFVFDRSLLEIRNNRFARNNLSGAGREVAILNAGFTDVILTLDDNSSANRSIDLDDFLPPFNFDLRSFGDNFNVILGNNEGSVGSQDFSVFLPR